MAAAFRRLSRISDRRWLLLHGRWFDGFADASSSAHTVATGLMAMRAFALYIALVTWAVDLIGALIPRPIWRSEMYIEQDGGVLTVHAVIGVRWLRLLLAIVEPVPIVPLPKGEYLTKEQLYDLAGPSEHLEDYVPPPESVREK